ncbi:MAG: hypothetical protein WCP20_11625 [Desulfuromonadales bacterium]
MAKTAEIKIPSDIEFRVIGNAFGVLIASAGLLAGTMVNQRSFDYWLDDIVPLVFVTWMCFRLYRNFLSTLAAYPDIPAPPHSEASTVTSIRSEPVIAGQITSKKVPTAEQVMDEVSKRIEAKRAEAEKANKFTN